MNKMQNIIEEIKKLEKELLVEIEKKEEEFFYKIKGKKIYFEEEAKKYQKKFHVKLSSYLIHASFLNMITFPIIWFCLIPAICMDASATFYQMICFPIYGIPKVKRSEYIIIDRHSLQYLNIVEKLNCSYCGYFNGLLAYIQEIAARTEQYWCPIKHARKLAAIHSRYHKFMEYGDCKDYQDNSRRYAKISVIFNKKTFFHKHMPSFP
jgi:hypothetical protein